MVARATDEPARVCPLVANELAATTAPASAIAGCRSTSETATTRPDEGQHDPEAHAVLRHLGQHAVVEERRRALTRAEGGLHGEGDDARRPRRPARRPTRPAASWVRSSPPRWTRTRKATPPAASSTPA